MLYLTRKIGESVIINGDIEVTVIEVRGRSVRLGFNFPANASVLRREIFERIQAENREAAEAASVLEELTGGSTTPPAASPALAPAQAPAASLTLSPAPTDIKATK